MEGKIINYAVAVGVNTDFLVDFVNANLSHGWELCGPPFFGDGLFCQAMVKREQPNLEKEIEYCNIMAEITLHRERFDENLNRLPTVEKTPTPEPPN